MEVNLKNACIQVISKNSEKYSKVCSLIENVFSDAFDARIKRTPGLILAIEETSDLNTTDVCAAMILNTNWENQFFSEQYFEGNIETLVSAWINSPVKRTEIVEIGGLASDGARKAAQQLIAEAPWFLMGMGYRYALVTITAQVRFLFNKTGIIYKHLCVAREECLPESHRAIWGRYYEQKPETCVVDLFASHLNLMQQRHSRRSIESLVMKIVSNSSEKISLAARTILETA